MAIGTLAYKIMADHRGFMKNTIATRKELQQSKRLFEATKSPVKKYGEAVDRLAGLHRKGTISTKTFNSALAKQRKAMMDNVTGANTLVGKIGRLVIAYAGFSALKGMVGLAKSAQQDRVAIEAMTGSVERAKTLLDDISEFSTVTPFEPGELRQAARQLLAFSVSADDVLPTLKTMGDLSAGTGRNIGEFINILGKVKDQGKISAETLNEFGLRSVPLTRALAETMGVASGEVRKLASQGKVGFPEMMKALQHLTSEGELFGGAMERQSKTLAGQLSTLTGNVKILASSIGNILVPPITDLVGYGNQVLGWIQKINPETVQWIVKITAMAGGIVLSVLAIGKLIAIGKSLVVTIMAIRSAIITTLAFSGPAGWAQLAVGAAVAAGSIYAVNRLLSGTNKELEEAGKNAKETTKATKALADAGVSSKQLEDQKKLVDEGKRLTESLRTPAEVLKDKIANMNKLVKAGAITWDIYRRGITKARKELDPMKDKLKEASKEKQDFSSIAAFSQKAFDIRFGSKKPEPSKEEKELLAESKKHTSILDRIALKEPPRVIERTVDL